MTIQTAFPFDVPVSAPRGIRWERNNAPGKIGARYYLCDGDQDTGFSIAHCGHPTANYPYIGYSPDGEVILAGNGRGFMKLAYAKSDVTAAYLRGG